MTDNPVIFGVSVGLIGAAVIAGIGTIIQDLTHTEKKHMDDSSPKSFTHELYSRLRYPPYNASKGERDALIDQIQEDPDAFWHRIATNYAHCPNGRDKCLQDMLTEYRGTSVGGAYKGRG